MVGIITIRSSGTSFRDNRCTCAYGAFFPLVGGQTCADCTRMCANANQAKVVARAARETMRDVMYQSFNGRRHRYNRYLPRQNSYGGCFSYRSYLGWDPFVIYAKDKEIIDPNGLEINVIYVVII